VRHVWSIQSLSGRFPRTVRVRLASAFALLFLLGGALLLGVTDLLLAHGLPAASTSHLTGAEDTKLSAACRVAEHAGPSAAQLPNRLIGVCERLAAAGADAAAARQRGRALHELPIVSLIGLAVMTVASGVLGWVMAGRVLRPVKAITGAAKRASGRHLGERVDLRGPRDELKELADTFDEMLDRLDAAFSSQRRFVADASHELRTPLTLMRTAIDVTLAKPTRSKEQVEAMAAIVRRSVDNAEQLIDALLALAVSERDPTDVELADLATVVEDALDNSNEAIRLRTIRVTTNLDEAQVNGDPILLERLARNLVENAVRHNFDGGWIDVRTRTDGDSACLEISNSGQLIDGAKGVGLGLAIVRAIVTAHGGAVTASSRVEGGLTLSASLPLANLHLCLWSTPPHDVSSPRMTPNRERTDVGWRNRETERPAREAKTDDGCQPWKSAGTRRILMSHAAERVRHGRSRSSP
jgi:signal transduction histidine kinase